jgi:hypothetical protein
MVGGAKPDTLNNDAHPRSYMDVVLFKVSGPGEATVMVMVMVIVSVSVSAREKRGHTGS